MTETETRIELVAHPSVVLARVGFLLLPVVALAISLVACMFRGIAMPLLAWATLAVGVFASFSLLWRASRIDFRVDTRGVEIDNLYRTILIPWAGVQEFSWPEGGHGRLRVLRRFGQAIPVDVTSGVFGQRRSTLLAELQRRAELHAGSVSTGPAFHPAAPTRLAPAAPAAPSGMHAAYTA